MGKFIKGHPIKNRDIYFYDHKIYVSGNYLSLEYINEEGKVKHNRLITVEGIENLYYTEGEDYFVEIGGDSILVVSLINKIQDLFGVELPFEKAYTLNIVQLAEFVKNKQGQINESDN